MIVPHVNKKGHVPNMRPTGHVNKESLVTTMENDQEKTYTKEDYDRLHRPENLVPSEPTAVIPEEKCTRVQTPVPTGPAPHTAELTALFAKMTSEPPKAQEPPNPGINVTLATDMGKYTGKYKECIIDDECIVLAYNPRDNNFEPAYTDKMDIIYDGTTHTVSWFGIKFEYAGTGFQLFIHNRD